MAPRALATRRPAATVSRLGRCPANLCREALDLASRALARIAAPSRPNPKIIVANRHVSPEIGAATRRHIEIAPYSETRATRPIRVPPENLPDLQPTDSPQVARLFSPHHLSQHGRPACRE